MKKIKLLFVFGTRPEAIKMAPLIHELKSHHDHFEVRFCSTGQHKEMLDQVLDLFEIAKDYDLDVMAPGQQLAALTARILTNIDPIYAEFEPNIVLVHGDTTSAMAAGIAAYYRQIPVAHIEAGLRTGDIYSPFPEEINRSLLARIAAIHFAPTEQSRLNLLAEGVSDANIIVTGNTVIDALKWMVNRLKTDAEFGADIVAKLRSELDLNLEASRIVLITGHRRENFGKGFDDICGAIRDLSAKHADVEFIYPVHLNPQVAKPVHLKLGKLKNVHLIRPLDYSSFVYLLTKSYLILTDSGGIQEEAPFLGLPVLVMRDTTERPEAVTAGTARLVGTSQMKIFDGVNMLLTNNHHYEEFSKSINPFGDGRSCGRIAKALLEL